MLAIVWRVLQGISGVDRTRYLGHLLSIIIRTIAFKWVQTGHLLSTRDEVESGGGSLWPVPRRKGGSQSKLYLRKGVPVISHIFLEIALRNPSKILDISKANQIKSHEALGRELSAFNFLCLTFSFNYVVIEIRHPAISRDCPDKI